MADHKDWKDAELAILSKLDIASVYRDLGVVFTRDTPTNKGWLACHAMGRADDTASAAVNVGDCGMRGRYRDMGGEGLSLNLWEFAALFGKFPDWRAARRHYADKAGQSMPAGGEPKRPDDQVEFINNAASDTILQGWVEVKDGFGLATIKDNGAVYGRYPKKAKPEHSQYVAAFPAYNAPGWADGDPSAWVIANTTGDPVVLYRGRDKEPSKSKTLSVGGSVGGLLGLYALRHIDTARVVWKVEGLSDMLTLHAKLAAEGLLGEHVVLSNSQGALEAVKPGWVELLSNKTVYVVHDCDRPGQTGAERWVRALAGNAAEVRNVRLPYPIKDNHGQDLRDYLFFDGHSVKELLDLTATAEPVGTALPHTGGTPALPFGIPAGTPIPTGLSNADAAEVGLPIQAVADRLFRATGGWPKRVGPLPFAEGEDGPLWLEDQNQFFGWAAAKLGGAFSNPLEWHSGHDKVTKGEFVAHVGMTAEPFEAVEVFPHEPLIARHYYMHPAPAGGDGSALNALVAKFKPASGVDRELFKAMILTLFWGGPGGQRPAFLITSDEDDAPGKGRGVGKTTSVRVVTALVGGFLSIRPTDSADEIMKRLLSPDAMTKRAALIDNLKSHRFSWADLEDLITAETLSGRRLYHGEGRRPGVITWFITCNGASLSKDMAQRVVPVVLSRPPYTDNWEREVADLLATRRWEIIGDILAALRAPAKPLVSYTRWALWESEVLARLNDPDAVLAEVVRRREEVDDDRDESDIVRDSFVAELRRRGHDPETQVIWITSAQAHPMVTAATGRRLEVNAAGKLLRGLSISELLKCNLGTGRGWLWTGTKAGTGTKRVPLIPSAEEQVRDLLPPPEQTVSAAVAETKPAAPIRQPDPPLKPGWADDFDKDLARIMRPHVEAPPDDPFTGAFYLHGF